MKDGPRNKPLDESQIWRINVILAVLGITKKEVAERLDLQENYVRQQLGGFDPVTRPVQDGLVDILNTELFGRSRRSSDSWIFPVPTDKRRLS